MDIKGCNRKLEDVKKGAGGDESRDQLGLAFEKFGDCERDGIGESFGEERSLTLHCNSLSSLQNTNCEN